MSNKSQILNYFSQIKEYLKDTSKLHPQPGNAIAYNMYLSEKIEYLDINEKNNENIILVQQFYIDKNEERQKEILKCLQLNIFNNSINKIYLLNEKIYTNEELGLKQDNNKIIQININKRLSYKDIFDFVENNNIKGFIILSNSDIFFNKSISELNKMNIIKNKCVLALNRYDYIGEKLLTDCKLFDNGRPDSQDTWIFHSSNNIESNHREIFNFNLGKPGCDNKICYLFNLLNYKCYNEPTLIKTFHLHNIQSRNYTSIDKIQKPYTAIFPVLQREIDIPCKNKTYNIINENIRLSNYIHNKIQNNETFIIPKIGESDNQLAYLGVLYSSHKSSFKNLNINTKNLKIFSQIYLDSFRNSELYFSWEPWSINAVENNIHESIVFMYDNFKKPIIWTETLFIYNLIQSNNIWLREIQDKRILVISSFNNKIKITLSETNKSKEIYGIDLFKNCSFEFLDIPNFNNDNVNTLNNFDNDFKNIMLEINKIKDNFDIAFVCSNIYSNLILTKLHSMNKSGINMDGTLHYLFGLYDNKLETERKEILTLYKNKYWNKL
jgi:hypothetical protein